MVEALVGSIRNVWIEEKDPTGVRIHVFPPSLERHWPAVPPTERVEPASKKIVLTPPQLEVVVTVKDPDYYTREWQARFVYALRNDVRLEDYVCGEPHRDISSVAGVRRP